MFKPELTAEEMGTLLVALAMTGMTFRENAEAARKHVDQKDKAPAFDREARETERLKLKLERVRPELDCEGDTRKDTPMDTREGTES